MSFASKEKIKKKLKLIKNNSYIILCFVYIVHASKDSSQMLVSQTTYMKEGFES